MTNEGWKAKPTAEEAAAFAEAKKIAEENLSGEEVEAQEASRESEVVAAEESSAARAQRLTEEGRELFEKLNRESPKPDSA